MHHPDSFWNAAVEAIYPDREEIYECVVPELIHAHIIYRNNVVRNRKCFNPCAGHSMCRQDDGRRGDEHFAEWHMQAFGSRVRAG